MYSFSNRKISLIQTTFHKKGSNKRCLLCFLGLCMSLSISAQPVLSSHYVVVNGLRLHYQESGKGTPLIYLHAFTRTASDWQDHAELAHHYRVLAIDLPGHGGSEPMDTSLVYSHQKAAQYILGLLDHLRIDSGYVMGYSSGAMIGLYLATTRPQMMKKLILVSGQLYFSATTRQFITNQGPETANPERLDAVVKAHGRAKGLLLLNQFYHFRKLYGDPMFTPDQLATLQAKTFIIHGDDDPIAPVRNAWEMYQSIPGARLWIVPGGGHVPHIVPGNLEDFNRRLLLFLATDKKVR